MSVRSPLEEVEKGLMELMEICSPLREASVNWPDTPEELPGTEPPAKEYT